MSRGLGTNMFTLRYKRSVSMEFKNGARHLKEHPKTSKFTKFDCYWFKRKGMAHYLVCIWGTGSLESILSSLISKVYHAFEFKPISVKFGTFIIFWCSSKWRAHLIQSILNIHSKRKYVRSQSPARLEHGQLLSFFVLSYRILQMK